MAFIIELNKLILKTSKKKKKDTCSLEEKLEIILKNRDIALVKKVRRGQAMAFPVVKCVGESWTIKKAESQL